jgi:hypothetical protein
MSYANSTSDNVTSIRNKQKQARLNWINVLDTAVSVIMILFSCGLGVFMFWLNSHDLWKPWCYFGEGFAVILFGLILIVHLKRS